MRIILEKHNVRALANGNKFKKTVIFSRFASKQKCGLLLFAACTRRFEFKKILFCRTAILAFVLFIFPFSIYLFQAQLQAKRDAFQKLQFNSEAELLGKIHSMEKHMVNVLQEHEKKILTLHDAMKQQATQMQVMVVEQKRRKCSIHFIVPTVPRTLLAEPFAYLRDTVLALVALQSPIFIPCVHVFNMKGDAEHNNVRQTFAGKNVSHSVTFYNVQVTENAFTNIKVRDNVRKQGSDFLEMLKHAHEHVPSGELVFLMEDDFVFCPKGLFHLLRVMQESQTQTNWIAFRVSFGLNGIMMQRDDLKLLQKFLYMNLDSTLPIDWLVEYHLNQNKLPARLTDHNTARLIYHNRTMYTYRFQIMEHIGTFSTIGNKEKRLPLCYENQYASAIAKLFDFNECANSLFDPCTNARTGFQHDQMVENEPFSIAPTTPSMALSDLKQIEVKRCAIHCTQCCKTDGMNCIAEALRYINHCDELRRIMNAPTMQCEHAFEIGAPYLEANRLHVGILNSRFHCDDYFWGTERFCTCKR